ncbi:Small conductance calcium-activated potassium channel protein [Dufourea novaeangliae]|uniref:Small conductance calcium-activated potassium channel protein n=1 Tax=Dufourea novaeangliae TaxID=178035 RepID=A0A154PMT6_DUFNO|nr:Small conductance calcium-activated potassium channel protein [Dufourea novaeangliae]
MNTNGNIGSQEGGNGTDYGSTEETAALLSRGPPPPVVVPAAVSQGKPVLTRQDRTTFLVASPQLSVSGLGGSEESGTNEDPATRSVPDIELHCRLDGDVQPQSLSPQPQPQTQVQLPVATTIYRSRQSSHQHKCRCDRRDSLAPSSAFHLARSVSRESVKSGHHCCPCQAHPPLVLVTSSPSTRIIRQSSQPEASACCCSGCCCPLHSGTAPSAASLRQLREPGDGIAGIAADSLRINGGIRQFRQFPWWCKSSSTTMPTTPPPPMGMGLGSGSGMQGAQGVVLCPRTLSQVRRSRLRRALTEATAETVNYVKTLIYNDLLDVGHSSKKTIIGMGFDFWEKSDVDSNGWIALRSSGHLAMQSNNRFDEASVSKRNVQGDTRVSTNLSSSRISHVERLADLRGSCEGTLHVRDQMSKFERVPNESISREKYP